MLPPPKTSKVPTTTPHFTHTENQLAVRPMNILSRVYFPNFKYNFVFEPQALGGEGGGGLQG